SRQARPSTGWRAGRPRYCAHASRSLLLPPDLRGACARPAPSRMRWRTATSRRRCEKPERDPKGAEEEIADEGGAAEDHAGNDGGAHGDIAARAARQAFGDGEKGWREPDRVDHDKQRHKRRYGEEAFVLDKSGRLSQFLSPLKGDGSMRRRAGRGHFVLCHLTPTRGPSAVDLPLSAGGNKKTVSH